MHPRLSVSEVSSWNWSFDEDLSFYEKAGIDAVGVTMRKLTDRDPADVAAALEGAGLRVTNLTASGPFRLDAPETWGDQREAMGNIMDMALAIRPEVVVLTTGAAGVLPWERAADAFDEVMAGPVAEADREGLVLAVEHTHALRTDVGFVHTLRDAMELGWRVGMGACLEVNACWAERNLVGTITAGIEVIRLVQVSDYAIGTTSTPDRLVPGDGDLPLARILGFLLDAGYDGVFDIEVIGPRIEEEGYASAIGRSLDHMTELIDELTAPPPTDDETDETDDQPFAV